MPKAKQYLEECCFNDVRDGCTDKTGKKCRCLCHAESADLHPSHQGAPVSKIDHMVTTEAGPDWDVKRSIQYQYHNRKLIPGQKTILHMDMLTGIQPHPLLDGTVEVCWMFIPVPKALLLDGGYGATALAEDIYGSLMDILVESIREKRMSMGVRSHVTQEKKQKEKL